MKKNNIVYATCPFKRIYNNNSLWGRIKDKLYTKYEGEIFIKELGISISNITLPPNFNDKAFKKNVYNINKKFCRGTSSLALKSFRKLDYYFYDEFQKKLFAYSVVKSIQLLLMMRNKSIKSNCILIFDAADYINEYIIYNLAQKAKYIILLSKDLRKIEMLQEDIICNYGVSPIVTSDFDLAIKYADFIVMSRKLDLDAKCPIWYVDNMYLPKRYNGIIVNDVTYESPWENKNFKLTSELLGAILNIMQIKDIEKFLQDNKIFIKDIEFKSIKSKHNILWKNFEG